MNGAARPARHLDAEPDTVGAIDYDGGVCSGAEVFALRIIGSDMAPEFDDGDIIIVEPGGAVRDGSFVLAQVGGEWVFRQLRRDAQTRWILVALNPDGPAPGPVVLPDLGAVRGVVIQKAVPGRRRLSRFYA
jgi:SOS-response transcriptional repressor LexA